MSTDADAVLHEALALSVDDRADVAAGLPASLDAGRADEIADAELLWAEEIERRARHAMASNTGGETWDGLRRRLTEEFTGG